MQKGSTKKVATYGMLIALAFIFSYIESLIPFNLGVPGIKLGLANIVILIALYLLGPKAAFFLSIVRVLLTAMTFGNMMMLWFSIAGASMAFLTMFLMKKIKGFSMVGVSIAGGVAHNVGQIIVAMIVMSEVMINYLFVLIIGGTITGMAIGIVGAVVYQKLKPIFKTID
ncbi:MAG: Gx transporter family protein [Clostridiales bacterium]|nr:Gx transporter family protein [Clostridiales bacterium]